jgi:hypothetical protein
MKIKLLLVLPFLLILFGCNEVKPYDYSEYRKSIPKSILVLPPKSASTDLNATQSILANVTYPLAESGYYVFPVALVDETFKQNGVSIPDEMHNIDIQKLREIFGADAVLYINIEKYGVSYKIIKNVADVKLTAKLVNTTSGKTLWEGESFASSSEGDTNTNGMAALIGALISAIVTSVQDDPSYQTGVIATNRLINPNATNGILYGPRFKNSPPR